MKNVYLVLYFMNIICLARLFTCSLFFVTYLLLDEKYMCLSVFIVFLGQISIFVNENELGSRYFCLNFLKLKIG